LITKIFPTRKGGSAFPLYECAVGGFQRGIRVAGLPNGKYIFDFEIWPVQVPESHLVDIVSGKEINIYVGENLIEEEEKKAYGELEVICEDKAFLDRYGLLGIVKKCFGEEGWDGHTRWSFVERWGKNGFRLKEVLCAGEYFCFFVGKYHLGFPRFFKIDKGKKTLVKMDLVNCGGILVDFDREVTAQGLHEIKYLDVKVSGDFLEPKWEPGVLPSYITKEMYKKAISWFYLKVGLPNSGGWSNSTLLVKNKKVVFWHLVPGAWKLTVEAVGKRRLKGGRKRVEVMEKYVNVTGYDVSIIKI